MEPAKLTSFASTAIATPANAVWVSAASAWEFSIKVHAGKLTLNVGELFQQLTQHGIGLLGIGVDDAIGAGSLDWMHRDPFDRVLAAQARRSGFRLATRDAELREFLGDLALDA